MLTPTEDAVRLNSPPLQGWGLSASALAELQARASQMRRNPTEPEKRVWRILSNSQMDGAKFRRQAVIGGFIADFLCPAARLIVEVDGDTHDEAKDRLRDDMLAAAGFRTMRVNNADVMTNLDGVAWLIRDALAAASARAARPHPNPSPEGEGLRG
jgi:very-short-patch-repair endonuclease